MLWGQLVSVLAVVPATLWGVMAGSLFSLTGVVLSNRASERRQRSQFLHDVALRRDERELTLRKDIYLAATEAVQEGAVLLGKLSNLESTTAELSQAFLAKLPALAKVQLIAGVGTTKLVVRASGFLSASILRLTGQRIPLDIPRQQLLIMRVQAEGFEKERDRWLEEMKKYNLSGVLNAQLWATLQGNFNFEDRRATEAHAKISADTLALFSRQMDFAAECLDVSRQLVFHVVPVVVAMRAELGIPINEQEYRGTMDALVAQQAAATDAFLAAARAAVSGS